MPRQPTLAEVIGDGINSRLEDLHVATIGRVETYDPATQTANVRPVIQRAFNVGGGEHAYEEICVLPNVPVLFQRCGGYVMTMPVSVGDHVLLVFGHDDMGPWRETGSVSKPQFLGRHGLSNAVAIPGIAPMSSPLSPADLVARVAGLVLGKDGALQQVRVNDTGIELGANAIEPVAKAPALVAAMTALAAALTQMLTMAEVVASQPMTAAVTAAAGACTAAAAATPSTVARTL